MAKKQQENITIESSQVEEFNNLTVEEIEELLVKDETKFKVSVIDENPSKADFLPKEQVNQIINTFAKKSGSNPQLSITGITALIQAGGSNSSMPPITKTVSGVQFSLKTLRDTVDFVTDKKGTVRQLAKSLRVIIAQIAYVNGWLGPLAKTLVKEYPDENFSSNDLVYAAEFHEDNMDPKVPPNIRRTLSDRASKLRSQRQEKSKKKKKR